MLLIDHLSFRRHALLASVLFLELSFPLFCQLASEGGPRKPRIQTVPVKTSICEALAHPERFNGELIEIEARYSATFEGAWISDSACHDYLGELVDSEEQALEKQYADAVGEVKKRVAVKGVLRNETWREFDSASRQIYTGMGTTKPDGTTDWGKYDFIAAEFTGVLVIRRNFCVRNGFGNGWGHLGASRFLLILNLVSNVTPHPL